MMKKVEKKGWEHFCHAKLATRNLYSWGNGKLAQEEYLNFGKRLR
jgi:hypothetical protein